MKEENVLQALRALAESDREKKAPPEVETRLLSAFRARRGFRRRWGIIAATAAALVIAATLWWTKRAPQPAVSAAPQISLTPTAMLPVPAVAKITDVAPARRKVARKIAAVRQPESREVVTDFFPLMNPEPAFERGELLRVQLPAAAMQAVGLPVREEHLGDLVQADVLVGEEGLARAIRFVRFDVK